jgi:hypothetical protein
MLLVAGSPNRPKLKVLSAFTGAMFPVSNGINLVVFHRGSARCIGRLIAFMLLLLLLLLPWPFGGEPPPRSFATARSFSVRGRSPPGGPFIGTGIGGRVS